VRNSRDQVLGWSVDRLHIVVAGTIFILGFVLRFVSLAHHSFDGDELASYYFAHFSLWQLWTEELDTHPPLYYSTQKVLLTLGASEALFRAPVALLGSAAVLLTYLLAQRIVGGTAALLAAALMAISPPSARPCSAVATASSCDLEARQHRPHAGAQSPESLPRSAVCPAAARP
jgi:predicted membrane-bound mannosyltransferase